jgi:hypothetical protein
LFDHGHVYSRAVYQNISGNVFLPQVVRFF